MLLSNALNWLTTQSGQFGTYLNESGTEIEKCWNITCNLIQHNVNGFIPIEISFDFGNPGQSTQDIKVRLFYNSGNDETPFSIHQIINPWHA